VQIELLYIPLDRARKVDYGGFWVPISAYNKVLGYPKINYRGGP
jgi:hypothetical protein